MAPDLCREFGEVVVSMDVVHNVVQWEDGAVEILVRVRVKETVRQVILSV